MIVYTVYIYIYIIVYIYIGTYCIRLGMFHDIYPTRTGLSSDEKTLKKVGPPKKKVGWLKPTPSNEVFVVNTLWSTVTFCYGRPSFLTGKSTN